LRRSNPHQQIVALPETGAGINILATTLRTVAMDDAKI
jgi:hypothetical protein